MSRTWVAMTCCALLLAGCTTAVDPAEPTVLRLAGSTAMLPLLRVLTTAFSRDNPHVRWDLQGGGSALGLERLQAGEVDLASCSSATYLDGELSEGITAVPIARDGLEIVVHPSNLVEGLTLLQLRDVYAGRLLDWADVGGREGDILVVSREDGSGTRAEFERLAMGDLSVTLTAVVMPSSSAMLDYVSSHRAAIGYASMGVVHPLGSSPDDTTPAAKPAVKGLRIEEALPTVETVTEGVYHLVRALHLVVPDNAPSEVRAFVDFVLSPGGQAIVGQRYGRIR